MCMSVINLEDPVSGRGGCSFGAYLALSNGQKGGVIISRLIREGISLSL